MADNLNSPTTVPGTQQASNAGAGPEAEKLIAGKFKSVEEAVEKGYTGLEEGFHALSERVGTLTRLLEAAVAEPQAAVPTVQGGQNYQNYDPYNRYGQQQNFDAADFITNPIPHLQKREDQLMQRVVKTVTDVVSNSMAVADFKARNPDMVKHEPLVQTFMRQTDPRKSVTERLEDSAKLTRQYLASHLKIASNSNAPRPDEFVEQPGSSAVSTTPASAPTPINEEAELVNYINERNAERAQNFGMGFKK